MEDSAANRRKRKCLVSILAKAKIKTFEDAAQVLAETPGFGSMDLSVAEVNEIFAEAKELATPKWEKKVKKFLDIGWAPKEEPWIDFELMREAIQGSHMVAYDVSCVTWSPVEAWCVVRRGAIHYVRSMLTDEEYYVMSFNGTNVMLPAGIDRDLIKNRSLTSGTINAVNVRQVFTKLKSDHIKTPDLIQKVIEKSDFNNA